MPPTPGSASPSGTSVSPRSAASSATSRPPSTSASHSTTRRSLPPCPRLDRHRQRRSRLPRSVGRAARRRAATDDVVRVDGDRGRRFGLDLDGDLTIGDVTRSMASTSSSEGSPTSSTARVTPASRRPANCGARTSAWASGRSERSSETSSRSTSTSSSSSRSLPGEGSGREEVDAHPVAERRGDDAGVPDLVEPERRRPRVGAATGENDRPGRVEQPAGDE